MRTSREQIAADVEDLSRRLAELCEQDRLHCLGLVRVRAEKEIVSGLRDDLRHALCHLAQWPDGADPLTTEPNVTEPLPL